MTAKTNHKLANFLRRDFIKRDEGKLTIIQIFGFILITLGFIYFASFLLPSGIIKFLPSLKLDDDPTPTGVSISFFTIMLGVAFAFPQMLQGQTKDISTMRIIVFMFANVLCMLIIKIGWDKHSLTEIGLDGFWMGVIAFLFGAKATQAYFENSKNLLSSKQSIEDPNKLVTYSKIAIAQIAKVQNEEKLHEKFPSIEFVSDTLNNGESCLAIYLKDNNISGIPLFVNAQLNDTTVIKVATEVISNIGESVPHIAQLSNNIANHKSKEFLGSICCLVESTIISDFKGVLTSGHIFTNGEFMDYEGLVNSSQEYSTLSNDKFIGKLYFQQMIPNQDLAIVKLNKSTKIDSDLLNFPGGFYSVSQSDLNSPIPNITILSKGNRKRDAFILDINISMRLSYIGAKKIMRNIILIGSDIDKNKSKAVSIGGDSGSCVFHKTSRKMIGMLLGGNDKFSFVLPFEQTLINNNFKLI